MTADRELAVIPVGQAEGPLTLRAGYGAPAVQCPLPKFRTDRLSPVKGHNQSSASDAQFVKKRKFTPPRTLGSCRRDGTMGDARESPQGSADLLFSHDRWIHTTARSLDVTAHSRFCGVRIAGLEGRNDGSMLVHGGVRTDAVALGNNR